MLRIWSDSSATLQCWEPGLGTDVQLAEAACNIGLTPSFDRHTERHIADHIFLWRCPPTDVEAWTALRSVPIGIQDRMRWSGVSLFSATLRMLCSCGCVRERGGASLQN